MGESSAGPGATAAPRFGVLSRLLTRIGGDALGRRLARGALGALVINVLSLLVALLAQMILARSLGVEGYGVFAYVMGWVNLLVVPALVGFQTAQLRYVASYRATEDWASMRGVSAFADRIVLGAGIACSLIALLVVWLLGDRLDPGLAQTFYVGLLMIPVLALVRARAAAVRALGGVVAALVPDGVVRQLTLLLGMGGLVLLLPTMLSPQTAMLVAMAGAVVALVLVSHARTRMWPEPARAAAPARRRREWLVTAMPLLLFATINIVRNQAGLLLLGWLGSVTEAGIYAIAARLGGLVAFPFAIINFVFTPTISHLHTKGDHTGLQRAATTTGWWVTIGTLAIALPLLVFPELFLSLFGEGFDTGATVLRILLAGAIIHALVGPVGPLMNMTGLERQASALMAVSAALTIVLGALLIPWLGMTGAALAGVVAGTFWNLAAAVVVWRRRRILSGVFGVLNARL